MTRLLAGPPVVRAPAARVAGGGSYAQQPPRKGVAAFSTLIESGMPYRYAEQARLLSNNELWQVYSLCPDVRAAVDAIVLKISTWDWGFKPRIEPSDPRYEATLDACETCRRFFAVPNTDGETYQEWTSKLLRDLLVFDALCVEHVRDAKGHLLELVAIRGGDVTPIVDTHQRLLFYKQINQVGQQIEFEPEEVTYLNLFPNTTAPGGKPLIETLVTEIITLMRQAKHVMLAYDSDEVPPGILVLAGIAGKAAERAKASLSNMKGNDAKLRVLTFDNPTATGAHWLELRHTPKDLDLKDIVKEVRRTVWRVFHVKPITMGDSESTPRATATVQLEAEEEGLIIPFLELWEQKVNARITPAILADSELASLIQFSFDREKRKSGAEEKEQADADASDMELGAMTINERRRRKGLPPVQGGDIPRIKDQQGWRPVSLEPAPETPEEATAGSPKVSDAAPGEAKKTKLAAHRSRFLRTTTPLVPDAWAELSGEDTLDLVALGDLLTDYHRAIFPLYQQIRVEVIATVRSYLTDDAITADEFPHVLAGCNRLLDRLGTEWSLATEPLYREAAGLGRATAITCTQDPSAASQWEADATTYHRQAMGYLWADRGLLQDLKTQLQQLLVLAARSKGFAPLKKSAVPELEPAELLAMVRKIFDGQEHRIANWSGKLLELGSMVASRGIEGLKGDEWAVTWLQPEHRGCAECHGLQARGKQPLSKLDRYPAGGVGCGGRCRCVLRFSPA